MGPAPSREGEELEEHPETAETPRRTPSLLCLHISRQLLDPHSPKSSSVPRKGEGLQTTQGYPHPRS